MSNTDGKDPPSWGLFNRPEVTVVMYGALPAPHEPWTPDGVIPPPISPLGFPSIQTITRQEFQNAIEAILASVREVEHEVRKRADEEIAKIKAAAAEEMEKVNTYRNNWMHRSIQAENELVQVRSENRRLCRKVNRLLAKRKKS